jgi:hypothetical protein
MQLSSGGAGDSRKTLFEIDGFVVVCFFFDAEEIVAFLSQV